MKLFFFILAWICFILGFIGAFLPVLPTTPFLLLSAYLFSKSSPRFHQWLLGLPIAGEAILDWQKNRVIRKKAKFLCSSMISLSLWVIWSSGQIMFSIKLGVSLILISVGVFVVTQKDRIG